MTPQSHVILHGRSLDGAGHQKKRAAVGSPLLLFSRELFRRRFGYGVLTASASHRSQFLLALEGEHPDEESGEDEESDAQERTVEEPC